MKKMLADVSVDVWSTCMQLFNVACCLDVHWRSGVRFAVFTINMSGALVVHMIAYFDQAHLITSYPCVLSENVFLHVWELN